jgi:hypothetical protein
MIERKVLYYPYIAIPDEWLKNAILYWDKVSSIEPDLAHAARRLDKWFEKRAYLSENGLFEPIMPENVVYSERGDKLATEFIQIIKNEDISVKRLWHINSVMEVYEGKFSQEVIDFLLDKRLAKRRARAFPNSYWVERKTSLIYLALLAKHLAENDRDFTTTSTDLPDYESIVYRPHNPETGFNSYSMILSNILPTPREDVPLSKIVKFKKDFGDNIYQLRTFIRDVQKEVVKAQEESEVKEVLVSSKENLEMEINQLNRELNKSNIDTFYSSVRATLNISVPKVIIALGINLTPISLPLKIVGALGLCAINIGSINRQKKYEQKVLKDNSPATYLYYAKKASIIR